MVDQKRLHDARARIARAEQQRRRRPDDAAAVDEVRQARAAYAAAKLEEHIRDLVADAPPLTDDQRARLSVLLGPPDQPAA